MSTTEQPFLELDSNTGVLRIFSPAGLIMHELSMIEQALVFQQVYNAHIEIATNRGTIPPGATLRITRRPANPLQVVQPITDPTK